jgi:opacity protein-like surface antigen
MRKVSVLAGAAAMAIAAMISNTASAADIAVEPEPVAENNWYVSIHGGIKFGEDWDDDFLTKCGEHCEKEWEGSAEADNGLRIGGAVGFLFSEILAIEGELSYMNQDFDEFEAHEIKKEEPYEYVGEFDGDVSIFTGMINLIAGVPVGGAFRPYVGAGLGFAHVSLDGDSELISLDDDDTSFAAQAFAGIDFGLTENIGLGIRGRILHINDLEFEDDEDCEHDIDVDLIKSVEAVLTFAF